MSRGHTDKQPTPKQFFRVLRNYWLSLLGAAALLSVIQWGVSQTDSGSNLLRLNDEWIQRQLAVHGRKKTPSVCVIDLTKSVPDCFETGRIPVPRSLMTEVIEMVALLNPRAIGVDVDLSPLGVETADPDNDPAFFLHCMDYSTRGSTAIPVVLGVSRTVGGGHHYWFADSSYASLLAGAILHPTAARLPRGQLVLWVEAATPHEATTRLWSLSAQMVRRATREGLEHSPDSWEKTGFEPDWWIWRQLVKSVESNQLGNPGDRTFMRIGNIVGDFSNIIALQKPPYTIPVEDLHKPEVQEFIRDKYVILGFSHGASTSDLFCVPGSDEPVAGVYLHASGVESLIQQPLLRLVDPWGKWALMFALATVVAAIAGGIVLLRHRRHMEQDLEVIGGGINNAALVIGLVACILYVGVVRVCWDDFLLALPFMTLSPIIEARIRKALKS